MDLATILVSEGVDNRLVRMMSNPRIMEQQQDSKRASSKRARRTPTNEDIEDMENHIGWGDRLADMAQRDIDTAKNKIDKARIKIWRYRSVLRKHTRARARAVKVTQ